MQGTHRSDAQETEPQPGCVFAGNQAGLPVHHCVERKVVLGRMGAELFPQIAAVDGSVHPAGVAVYQDTAVFRNDVQIACVGYLPGNQITEHGFVQVDDHAAHGDAHLVAAGEDQCDVVVPIFSSGRIGEAGGAGQKKGVGIFVIELEQPQSLSIVKGIQPGSGTVAGNDPVGGAVDQVYRCYTVPPIVHLGQQLPGGKQVLSGQFFRKQQVGHFAGLIQFIVHFIGGVQHLFNGSVSTAQDFPVVVDGIFGGVVGQISPQEGRKYGQKNNAGHNIQQQDAPEHLFGAQTVARARQQALGFFHGREHILFLEIRCIFNLFPLYGTGTLWQGDCMVRKTTNRV